jgi:hypothetical protein
VMCRGKVAISQYLLLDNHLCYLNFGILSIISK